MSRYIDADYLIDTIGAMIGYGTTPTDIWDMVNDAPTIDIVRCGECKWNDGKGHCKLRYGSLGVFEDVRCDDFCSYGERKTND